MLTRTPKRFSYEDADAYGGQRMHAKVAPAKVKFNDGSQQHPNFSDLDIIAFIQQKTDLYGQITMDVCESDDKNYDICFVEPMTIRRAWIGGIEDVSESNKIQSVGLRQKWVDAGDLTTPTYEYHNPGRRIWIR